MGTYRIAIHQSIELANYCESQFGNRDRAVDRAGTFIEGAVNESTPHTANAFFDEELDLPQQATRTGFSEYPPCDSDADSEVSYSHLLEWYMQYLGTKCNMHYNTIHLNVLLTNEGGTDGGIASGYGSRLANPAAVANTGPLVAELPQSYETFGAQPAHNAMHTVLEEVGHVLTDIDSASDGDGDSSSDEHFVHDFGAIHYRGPGNTVTPLGIDHCETNSCVWGTNNCGTSFSDDGRGVGGGDMFWSDCLANHLVAPSELE